MIDKSRIQRVMLAFVGVVMLSIALYSQMTGMDLHRHPLAQYLRSDMALPAWWAAVGTPFLVGGVYVLIAATASSIPVRLRFLAMPACFVLALTLILFGAGLGIFAAVSIFLLLIASVWRRARERG